MLMASISDAYDTFNGRVLYFWFDLSAFSLEMNNDWSMSFAGDDVNIIEYVNDDWARGEKIDHHKVGIFPLAFVSLVGNPCDDAATLTTTASTTDLMTKTTTPSKDDMTGKSAVVLFDFAAEAVEDLDMKEGEGIEVLASVDAEWGFGINTSNGKKGIFPWNFVEVIS